jgi:hypothetical protein
MTLECGSPAAAFASGVSFLTRITVFQSGVIVFIFIPSEARNLLL